MATWSALSSMNPLGRVSGQASARTGSINKLIYHHGATTSAVGMVQMMVNETKEVSANYVISNSGDLWRIVPEELRAWTSAAASWDGRAVTVECANLSTNGWTISAASYETLAQLAADVAKRYGFGIVRSGAPAGWSLLGHRELNLYFSASYATACPGSMDLNRIADRANEILRGATFTPAAPTPIPIPEEFDMSAPYYVRRDLNGRTYKIEDGIPVLFQSESDYRGWRVFLLTDNASRPAKFQHFVPPLQLPEITGVDESGWAMLKRVLAPGWVDPLDAKP